MLQHIDPQAFNRFTTSISEQLASLQKHPIILSEGSLGVFKEEIINNVSNQILAAILTQSTNHGRKIISISKNHFRRLIFDADDYLQGVIRNDSNSLNMMLERFTVDRGHLLSTEKMPCSALSSRKPLQVARRLSDPHAGGHVVRKLSFGSSQWIYKPRSMSSEAALQAIFKSLEQENILTAPPSYLIVARPEYGWSEYLCYMPAESREGIEKLYLNAGGMCAILTLLGVTDLHYENVIIHRGFPNIIDAEGLFQPTNKSGRQSLPFMLLRTGLIGLHSNAGGKIDNWSGISFARRPNIGASPGVDLKDNLIHIFSRWHSVPPYLNFPVDYQFNENDIATHINCFIKGYLNQRSVLFRNRNVVARIILEHLDALERKEYMTRIFLRSTRKYIQLRNANIIVQKNAYPHTEKLPASILDSEIRQLAKGDIPRFFTKLKSTSIFDDGHQIVERDFFLASPFSAQCERLNIENDFWTIPDIEVEKILKQFCAGLTD